MKTRSILLRVTRVRVAASVLCAGSLAACEPSATVLPVDAGADAAITVPDAAVDSGSDAGVSEPPIVGPDFVRFPEQMLPASGVVELAFEVPAAARAFVVSATSSQPGLIALLALTAPDGSVLFDSREPEAGPFRPALSYNLEDVTPLSVLYPSSPADPWMTGTYRAEIGFVPNAQPEAARVEADVVLQLAAAPTHVALNVWLARGSAYDAASLIGDPLFLSAFDALRGIFAAAEIALDPLQAFDLGAAGEDLSLVDSDAALSGLLGELALQTNGGLDVILVDQIDAGSGKTVRGKTLGIPGPPAHPELARRGAVLLALDALPADAGRIAEAFAHEIGHYLGLRHTTEMDGEPTDPIADTPECPYALASFESSTGELLLSAEDCRDYDGHNLLFPMPPRGADPQRVLTADQRAVILGHPLVH